MRRLKWYLLGAGAASIVAALATTFGPHGRRTIAGFAEYVLTEQEDEW